MAMNAEQETLRQAVLDQLSTQFAVALSQQVGEPAAAMAIVVTWSDGSHSGSVTAPRLQPPLLLKLGDSLMKATVAVVTRWKSFVNRQPAAKSNGT